MPKIELLTRHRSELWWLGEGQGSHGQEPIDTDSVADALGRTFAFVEESVDRPGLRAPQIGALHAVLAHRSTEETDPMVVVMPTGTGKTETMLAVFCHTPVRTLIIVPSDALRAQIAEKFVTLGILPKVGAVTGDFRCPVVLVLKHGVESAEDAEDLAQRANVIVATTAALNACSEEARFALTSACERLVVDEAHHLAARTWRAVAERFSDREVILFTATPFREDGRHLGGRIIYSYPLRLAQQHGYFARIEYHSVLDLAEPDRAVAAAAVERLRRDLAAGRDHLLMARVGSLGRAKQIAELYAELAPDLHPVRIDTGVSRSTQLERRSALLSGASRIVVCVNMLGEGFDLPQLKVAAIHDPQKSLAVTLQFVGRFARVGDESLGDASAFVPLQVIGLDERLRKLYGEDADWNEVLRDLTERHTGHEKERSDFERAFGSLPREVALRSIHPKMSTVTYRLSASSTWSPERIYDLFEGRLLTTRLGINHKDKVVWWVSKEATAVRWGEFANFNELVHHLHIAHVDNRAGFLYINSTNNGSVHEDIARAIGGDEVALVSGETIYRILAKVNRRVPTNVGLLDSVSRNRRFSMYVGQDVLHAWRGEGSTKMKTNIFAYGYTDGRSVSFGASRKGRVWSHDQATDILEWVTWARQVGPAITDESVSLESVMSGFLLPEPATVRPPYVPLAIEWPFELVATFSDRRKVGYHGIEFALFETELVPTSRTAEGPLTFELVTPSWSLEFEFKFGADEAPTVLPVMDDGEILTPLGRDSLAAFLTTHGLLVIFEDEVVLGTRGYLLRPNREQRLFPADSIEVFDWSGIDIQRESQKAQRDPTSVQYRAIEAFTAESDWEVVLDDDGAGELADIVLLRRVADDLEILLAHCKYSSKPTPGARIDDLYDVCGQAMKMNRAKSMPELLAKRLFRRENARQADGRTGIITGDLATLAAIVSEARYRTLRVTIAIVQPGMSKSAASEDMRALLGATERFLLETYGMTIRVIGSR